jgi:hypothetical protein
MSEKQEGPLNTLKPEELKILHGQIAAMLNYTQQGGGGMTISDSIKAKLTPEAKDYIKSQISKLLA